MICSLVWRPENIFIRQVAFSRLDAQEQYDISKYCPFRAPGLNKEKSKYQGSLRVKVRERKRDYEVPLKLTSAARWITSKQLQRATS